MPIYEYECQACNHRFEEWQKMSDKPVKVCPKCKARKVDKLISHTSFQLKGGGWYSDLYSSQKPGSSDKSGDKPESSASSSGTGADKKSGAESKAGETSGSTSTTTDSKDKSKGKKGATKAAAA